MSPRKSKKWKPRKGCEIPTDFPRSMDELAWLQIAAYVEEVGKLPEAKYSEEEWPYNPRTKTYRKVKEAMSAQVERQQTLHLDTK